MLSVVPGGAKPLSEPLFYRLHPEEILQVAHNDMS